MNRKLIMGKKQIISVITFLLIIPLIHANTVLYLQLEVFKNDTVILKNLEVMVGRTSYHSEGNYKVQLLDDDKNIISEKSLDINFQIMTDPPQEINSSPVSMRFDYDPSIRYLKVFRNETEIFFKDINTCNNNTICEDLESYLSCPSDCSLNSIDGICIKDKDGICDPDCSEGADPDCVSAVCGDGICQESETYKSCPDDCEKPELCGNGICEADENYETCPQDCPKKFKCGDRICSEGENYGNCAKDCSSGVADGYCDGAKDNICDPDCSRDEDEDCLCNKNGVCESEYEDYLNCAEDCEKPSHPIFLIAIPIIVIVVVLGYLIYSKSEKYEGGE